MRGRNNVRVRGGKERGIGERGEEGWTGSGGRGVWLKRNKRRRNTRGKKSNGEKKGKQIKRRNEEKQDNRTRTRRNLKHKKSRQEQA